MTHKINFQYSHTHQGNHHQTDYVDESVSKMVLTVLIKTEFLVLDQQKVLFKRILKFIFEIFMFHLKPNIHFNICLLCNKVSKNHHQTDYVDESVSKMVLTVLIKTEFLVLDQQKVPFKGILKFIFEIFMFHLKPNIHFNICLLCNKVSLL